MKRVIDARFLPKQMAFLRSTSRCTVFMGGIGSGKTLVGAWWALGRALLGRVVLVLVPTYGMGRDSFLPMLRKVLAHSDLVEGRDYQLNVTTLTLTIPGAGDIMIRSADSPDTVRGINAHDGLMDEFSLNKTWEAYNILVGRTRSSEDAQRRLTGTPTSAVWVRELVAMEGVELIRQATYENFFLPASYIEDLKKTYGEGTAWYRQEVLGELVDFSTGVIDATKIIMVQTPPPLHMFKWIYRAWDTASSLKTTGDYTATAKLGMTADGRVHVLDVQRKRGPYAQLRPWIIQTITGDAPGTRNGVESTQGGQIIISDLQTDSSLRGYPLELVPATKDKVSRALPFASRVSLGLVSMTATLPAKQEYLDELSSFGPDAEHDDMVDATAHAYNGMVEAKGNVTQTFKFNY